MSHEEEGAASIAWRGVQCRSVRRGKVVQCGGAARLHADAGSHEQLEPGAGHSGEGRKKKTKEERRRQRKKEEDKGCRRAHLHARMEKKKRKARMTLDEACAVSCSTFQKRALFVL